MNKLNLKSSFNISNPLNALILLTITLLTLPFLLADEQPSPEITSSSSQPPIETAFQQDQKEFQDATLTTSAGITPDSPFYFLDNLLDNFASDASNREEKIAEIRDMIKAGNVDDAKKALSRYQQFAKRTEQDISPEQEQQARKSAVAISHVIKEIKDDIPQEHQQEFVTDILTQEEKISTAAKVADKIKNLCETLSKLDPAQYAKTCKVGDNENVPAWQRSLDDKLTGEQQQEARAFFKTMSECTRNPANCQCDEITIKPFAEKCKVIAPLAAKCDQGDEQSCQAMNQDDENFEDLLPPHLQDIKQERQKRDGQDNNYLSPECLQAGIKDTRECNKYIFNLKAPPECKQAGLTGESEQDARQCEKIAQELNKDQVNPDNAFNNNFNNNHNQGPGMGFSFGKNCKDLTDQTEKLQCLEQFYNQVQQQQNNNQNDFQDNNPTNFDPSRAPPECRDTTSKDECRKIMDEKSMNQQKENEEKYRSENNNPQSQRNFYGNAVYPSPDQYQNKENQQPPYPEHQQQPYSKGQQPPNMNQPNMPPPNMQQPPSDMQQQPNMPPPDMLPPQPNQQPPFDQQQQPQQPQESPSPPPSETSPPPSESYSSPPPSSSPEHTESSESKEGSSSSSDSSSSTGSSESSSSSSSSSDSTSSSSSSTESSPITGNAIIDNNFLKYYWEKLTQK